MGSVELVVDLADRWVQKWDLGVESHLDHRNSCSFDDFKLFDPTLGAKKLLKFLQGSLDSLVLRQKLHPT